jgi:zinc protease
MTRFLSLCAVTLSLPWMISNPIAAAPSGSLPKGVEHVTSVEGIDEYRLDNGLQVIMFPDPSKQTTTVNITYLVGSAHEGYGEKGMAHLLEHMVFQGTPDHEDIPTELTSHGARANGTTWVDRTNYYETVAATDENIEWALDLEADRMMNSYVSREDLDSEMTVVRNEFEMGENYPSRVLEERVYSTAFLWHNYGNTTIGSRSDIEEVPIERLQAFYRTWYRPDNAVLVVAGKFDEAHMLELIQQKFGSLESPDVPMPPIYTVEPAQDGARTVTLRRVGDKQVVALGYHIPSGSHADHAALEVLAFLLADTPSGRLHKALVETNKATSVRANADRFKHASLMYVEAELRETGPLDEVRDEMTQLVEQFSNDAPTDEDVERAKTKLLRNWELTLRDSPRAAIRLSEWASLGDWRMIFLYRDRMEKVTAEDVVRVADTYFEESNRTVGLYLPTTEPSRVEIPPSPDLEELLAGYTGREAMAQGEAFDTSPASVESHARRTQLPGGMKLVTVPKKTRGETVNVALRLHIGDEKSLQNKATIARLTGDMLMRGTQTRTRQQIQDEVDALKATMRVYGYQSSVDATIEATRSTLPDALRLLADVLRNPSFPESELEQLREQSLQSQEEAKSDPRRRASNVFYRHLAQWPREDVRYVLTPDEAIAELNATELGQLKEFHENFYGASAAEMAVVGDFDADEIEALAGELFADWKSPREYSRLVSRHQDHPALIEAIETPDKESVALQAGVRFALRDDDADYPALLIGNFMTGGGFLSSRLAKRIREDEGLSYGVGSRFYASSLDENAWFTAYAIYAPQNDDAVLAAFREEIYRILSDGFTDGELEEARTGWLQSREVSRGRDATLARTLRDQAYLGRTMEWDENVEAAVAATTNDKIASAFRKHISVEGMSIVRAGDFAGVEKEAASIEEKEHAAR